MVLQDSGMEPCIQRARQAQQQHFSSEVNSTSIRYISKYRFILIFFLGRHRLSIVGLGNRSGRNWRELGAIDY